MILVLFLIKVDHVSCTNCADDPDMDSYNTTSSHDAAQPQPLKQDERQVPNILSHQETYSNLHPMLQNQHIIFPQGLPGKPNPRHHSHLRHSPAYVLPGLELLWSEWAEDGEDEDADQGPEVARGVLHLED